MAAPSTVRVFISSTFRDMHAERDYLSRIVFPELRSRCLKRGVEFVGLDLRWGVTEEESKERGALAVCLEEIEKCRPFFVCLLGDRFGWVPPPEEVPQELVDTLRGAGELPDDIGRWYRLDETTEPPVYRLRRDEKMPDPVVARVVKFWEEQELPLAGASITAREILRGVFEEAHPKTHALFYLRRPGVHRHPDFPDRFKPIFVEQERGPGSKRAKLARLKRDIHRRRVEVVVRRYRVRYAGLEIDPTRLPGDLPERERDALKDGLIQPAEWPALSDRAKAVVEQQGTVALEKHGTAALEGLEKLGEQVLEDLWATIEAELERPAERVLDDHERGRAYHERFLRDRSRFFLGRKEQLRRMLAYVAKAEDPHPLVVTGASGSGMPGDNYISPSRTIRPPHS